MFLLLVIVFFAALFCGFTTAAKFLFLVALAALVLAVIQRTRF